MTTLYLVRHGETDNNRKGTYNGCRANQPLNENGKRQAALLGQYFADLHFDAVYSSPLLRAVQTAEGARGTRELPILIDDDLREMDFGSWDGLRWGHVPPSDRALHKLWAHSPHLVRFPDGGEMLDEVIVRMRAALLRIVNANRDRTVLLASHGLALRALALPLLHLPASRIRDIDDLANTAFWRLEVFDDGTFNVTDWNAIPHLPPELKVLAPISNCRMPFSAPQIMGEHIFPDFERKV